MTQRPMNSFADRTWRALFRAYPDWRERLDVDDGGDLQVFVPSANERAGGLTVFTSKGKDLWLRLSPSRMCYSLDGSEEMLTIIRALLVDEVLFVRTTAGEKWMGTTLIHPGDEPVLQAGEIAELVSWSGRFDRTVQCHGVTVV